MKLYWVIMDEESMNKGMGYPDAGRLCIVKRHGGPFLAFALLCDTVDGQKLIWKVAMVFPGGTTAREVPLQTDDEWAYLDEGPNG